MLALCAGGKHTVHGQGLSGDSAQCFKKLSIPSAVTNYSA